MRFLTACYLKISGYGTDTERAINHLLELHARAVERMNRAESLMDRTDRQIAGIQKLVKTGGG